MSYRYHLVAHDLRPSATVALTLLSVVVESVRAIRQRQTALCCYPLAGGCREVRGSVEDEVQHTRFHVECPCDLQVTEEYSPGFLMG